MQSLNAMLGFGQLASRFESILRSVDMPRINQSLGEPGSSHVELSANENEVSYHGGVVDQNDGNIYTQVHVLLPIAEDIQATRGEAPRAIDTRFGMVRIFPTHEGSGYQSEYETMLVAGNPETYMAYARCVQLMAQGVLDILPPVTDGTTVV